MDAGPRVPRVMLLGAGLGLLLALLEVGTPRWWVGSFAALVSLVPVAVTLVLGGWPAAALAATVALGGGFFLVGSTTALAIGLRHVLPGLVLGWTLARHLSMAGSLALVTGVSLLGLSALVWVLVPAGTSPLALFERHLDAHIAELESLPGRLATGGDPGWAADTVRVLTAVMREAGPAVILVGLLLVALSNYGLARLSTRRITRRPFAEERVPDHLVWGVILAGLGLASGQQGLQRLGLNALILLAPFYALQGLAVLRHFCLRVGVPRPLQVLGFGLLVLQPPLLLLGSAGLGLADLWVDFRKIRGTSAPA
jgi:uncharacterized protein YybS (DUF2232 family)